MDQLSLRGFLRFWAAELVLGIAWLVLAALYMLLCAAIFGVLANLGMRGSDLSNVRVLAGFVITLGMMCFGVVAGIGLFGVKLLLAIQFAWPRPARRWWE